MSAHSSSSTIRPSRSTDLLRWTQGRSTAFWVGVVVVVLILVFNVASGGVFTGTRSINGLLLDGAVGILLACGVTFLLAAGMLDLSVGANLVLSSVSAAATLKAFLGNGFAYDGGTGRLVVACVVALAAALATGVAFGIVNGLVVTKLKVNSFIATLGTGGAATGLVLVLTDGSNITGFPSDIQRTIGSASIGDILPVQTALVLVIAGYLWFSMRRTRLGLYAVTIGSSTQAARRAGIRVDRTVIKLFAQMGLLAGLAGFLGLVRFSTTTIGGSEGAALAAIAAAVIGGTSLFGGVATVGGSVVGAFLPVVLASGLIVIGVPSFYQQIVVGMILILAVYIDQERRSRRLA
jgi:ribose transport system permease protein